MAGILADDNFRCIVLNENDIIPIIISRKFAPRSPIVNKPGLDQVMACHLFVQVMAWLRTSDKSLTALMQTQFINAILNITSTMDKPSFSIAVRSHIYRCNHLCQWGPHISIYMWWANLCYHVIMYSISNCWLNQEDSCHMYTQFAQYISWNMHTGIIPFALC